MEGTHLTQELADEYAIGSLDQETERLVLLHAASCEPCGALAREAERYASSLALGLGRARPSPALKQRVLVQAGIARPPLQSRVLRVAKAFAGVAAVIVAAGILAGMLGLRTQVGDLRRQNDRLQQEVDEALSQRVEIAALTERLKGAEALSAQLFVDGQADRDLLIAQLSPEANIADVVGVNGFEQAIGRLVWDEGQQRVWFIATRLPQRPEGETYELWVSAAGRWVSLGTLNPDTTGYARLESIVPLGLRGYESAVVTIETTGSVERRGPSVFVTDLSPFRR